MFKNNLFLAYRLLPVSSLWIIWSHEATTQNWRLVV